ncbi:MAG: fructose-bisphosphate aldolase class 1, partial [Alteromonas naphthalenivorans]
MKKKLIFLTLLSYLTQSYCAQIPLITNLESKIAALEKVKNNIDQTKELAQQILDRKIMPLVTLILNGDKNPDYRKQIKQWRLLKYMLEFHALALEQKHLLTNNTNALNTLRTTMLELETEHIKDKNRQWSHFVQRAALNQKVFKIIEQEIKKNLY